MIGIIIAAGLGSRMGVFTEEKPKCLLPINGRTLLARTVEIMRANGCGDIVIITGHKGSEISFPGTITVENRDYRNNNILHSLMYAREYLQGPATISYSDIWVEPRIYRELQKIDQDIVIAADVDWMGYYEGRTEHPLSEAENAFLDNSGTVVNIGKHLDPADAGSLESAEFLGLWKMSAAGTAAFKDAFLRLEARLDPESPFENSQEWRKAYITDMLQYLIRTGSEVKAARVRKGWAELDTEQDYRRLTSIARKQGLEIFETVKV